MHILNYSKEVVKEFFRFCFVSGVAYIITFAAVHQIAVWRHSKSAEGMFCSVTCEFVVEFKRIFIEVGSFWLLLASLLFFCKKCKKAWGIDLFIFSLIVLFVLPFILKA